MEHSVDFPAGVSVARIARGGSRTSAVTINFRRFLSETRRWKGRKKERKTSVKQRSTEETDGRRLGYPAVSSGVSSTIKNCIQGAGRFFTSGNSFRRKGRPSADGSRAPPPVSLLLTQRCSSRRALSVPPFLPLSGNGWDDSSPSTKIASIFIGQRFIHR